MFVMKNTLKSPRFLNEFDTVDALAVRNIAEKRKLRRKLVEFDKQLHSNLVRIESEILSIRLEGIDGNSKAGKSMGPKGKTKTELKENRNGDIAKDEDSKRSPFEAEQSIYNLPKITTLLTEKNEHDNGNDKLDSLQTITELGTEQARTEQRILMSLQRPRSKLNMQNGVASRPPTPQASNLLLSPLKTINRNRRASACGHLEPLPSEIVSKGQKIRAFSTPDLRSSMKTSDLGNLLSNGQMRNSVGELENEFGKLKRFPRQIPGELKAPAETVKANGIKICVTDENGVSKPEHSPKFKLDPVKMQKMGAKESKINNFDEVLRSRLQLLESGMSSREDLEKIRYLRTKDDITKNFTDEVQDIFALLH